MGIVSIARGVAMTLAALVITGPAFAQNQADYPVSMAFPSDLASRALLLDVEASGDRLIAVGEYGHIIYSDDFGDTWQQASSVPTRATLTSVDFVDAMNGWAVGHDAVILHTEDGGLTWERQYIDPLAETPLLSVHFYDTNHGLAVGAFSLAMETFDGGVTWETRFLDLEMDEFADILYHLNGIFDGPDGSVFVAAELGAVYRSTDGGVTFDEITTPYDGSFWGGLSFNGTVLVFGMRGNVWRSDDMGDSWIKVDSDSIQSFGGGAVLADGTIVLAGLGGAVTYSTDEARTFTGVIRPARRGHSAAAAAGENGVVVVGEAGAALMPGRAADYAPETF